MIRGHDNNNNKIQVILSHLNKELVSDPKWKIQAFCGIIRVVWGPDKGLELYHHLSLLSRVELSLQSQEFLAAADSINIQASVLHRKDVQPAGKRLLLFLTHQNKWHF